jgi:hypothetical protein
VTEGVTVWSSLVHALTLFPRGDPGQLSFGSLIDPRVPCIDRNGWHDRAGWSVGVTA